MEQPLTGKSQKKQKGFDCFSFESSAVISHYISLISNIVLFLILVVSEIGSKWIGIILHLIWCALLGYILNIIHHYSAKQIKILKLCYKGLFITILAILIYYICSLVELKKNESDQQFVQFFLFCFCVLMFYHIMFGVIIFRYVNFLAVRPKQKDNKIFIDKNLNELIKNSTETILIS